MIKKLKDIDSKKILSEYKKNKKIIELGKIFFNLHKKIKITKNKIKKSQIYFVHNSFKIENESLESIKHTEYFLISQKKKKSIEDKKKLQILNYYKIVQQNNTIFDEFQIKTSHKYSFLYNYTIQPGFYRQTDVYTISNSNYHQYINYEEVPDSMKYFCEISYKLFTRAKNNDEFTDFMNYLFLSAFVQFFFLDIHPFIDGNGRIGRLISSNIQNKILEIRVPMFSNKKKYIETLISGRKKNILNCCEELFELILEEGINYYKKIIKKY